MKNSSFISCRYFLTQGKCLFRLLILVIVSTLLCSVSNAIEIKGTNYAAWDANGLLTENSDTSLANARNVGCNWIGLNVYWFQNDANSALIEPNYSFYSPTPDAVVHAIDRCHQLHMKVMLRPVVQCLDNTWQGYINPSPQWFASYQNFINFWAKVAESNGVELLCIGTELTDTTGQSLSWTTLIQNIRQLYTGPLIYAANPDEEKSITWWDKLDYIGIDAYYSLTDQNNPTSAQLETAWSSRADAIENWRNSTWPNMQIIFTEVGYSSIDGTNKDPWLEPSSSYQIDLQEQADCYEALLSQCEQRNWWSGVFWWVWEAYPDAGGPDDAGFTPQNKPAEAVLANYYVCLRGDLNQDYKVNFDDLSLLATYWLSYHPAVDVYPPPDGDGIIDYRDFAVFARNWMVTLNLDGDINGDCKVDFEDLSRLASRWLQTCKPGSISEDINGDGIVNLKDYALLAKGWMQSPPP